MSDASTSGTSKISLRELLDCLKASGATPNEAAVYITQACAHLQAHFVPLPNLSPEQKSTPDGLSDTNQDAFCLKCSNMLAEAR
jgi:hypothetical protein